jgi:hypothetical protein
VFLSVANQSYYCGNFVAVFAWLSDVETHMEEEEQRGFDCLIKHLS